MAERHGERYWEPWRGRYTPGEREYERYRDEYERGMRLGRGEGYHGSQYESSPSREWGPRYGTAREWSRGDAQQLYGEGGWGRGFDDRGWASYGPDHERHRGGSEWGRGSGERDWGRGAGEYDSGRGRETSRYHGDDRGFFERAGDEVRSWFGDEEAQRRRMIDEGGSGWRDRGGRERGWDDRGQSERNRWTGDQWGFGPWPAGRHQQSEWDRSRGGFSSGTTGPHVGRGPRGWQRSDERIREDLCERMSRHGELDASDIEIVVTAGEVTLMGSVPDKWAKRLAEDLADDVSGVREVHNQIRVAGMEKPLTDVHQQQPAQDQQRWSERRIA